MKAFLTSIGENTTELCIKQLKRYGLDVILLDRNEKWGEKYTRFINEADKLDEDILRVDADIIVNKNVQEIPYYEYYNSGVSMVQFRHWDFYKNDLGLGNPVWYSAEAIKIIKDYLPHIDPHRPETWASRLSEIRPYKRTSDLVVGIHGISQNKEDMKRAFENKKIRGQLVNYDFDLAYKINKLYDK